MTTPQMPAVPKYLAGMRGLHNGTAASATAKQKFHPGAERWLTKLAAALGLTDYNIRIDRAGPASSGSVTLEGHRIVVRMLEENVGEGLTVLSYPTGMLGGSALLNAKRHSLFLRTLTESPISAEVFMAALTGWTGDRR